MKQNSEPQMKEILQVLDFNSYIYKEDCRTTLKLREMEQGYNNGRVISIKKQLTMREEFQKQWQEELNKVAQIPPDSVDERSNLFQESEQEIRLRRVQPTFRLIMSKEPKAVDLAKRIQKCLENAGFYIVLPNNRKNTGNLKIFVDRIYQGVLNEIYQLYSKTVGLKLEDGYFQFENMLRRFLMDYRDQINGNQTPKLFRQKSNSSKESSQNLNILDQKDLIKIHVNEREEPFNEMAALMQEFENMMDQIMSQSLCDEKDSSIQIYEWQYFDSMRNQYKDPLDAIENSIQGSYDPDIITQEFEEDQQKQEILLDKSNKNYIQEFYDKFQKIIMVQSPEFWKLLLFDILKCLCDSSLSQVELEYKLFNLISNVDAVKYLLIFRREIVTYLHRTKFWEQGTQNSQEVSKVIQVEEETQQKQKKKKELPMTQEQGLVEHDPNQYTRMDQQRLQQYFPTSQREDRQEYLKIRIDPIQRMKPNIDNLVKIEILPNWTRHAFEGTSSLNVIQSKIYDYALFSEMNVLVCAPTGAGKTNIALLTILQELDKRVDKNLCTLQDHNFKIVYISPMKALASEIVEKFQHKLKYLGVKVREYTGDMQLSKKELQETHIILTTPEKWDVVTRKSNSIQDQLQLLIIDEIHLLNDERGAILECVVARTLKQVQRAQRMVRLIGLSATLPNYWDVAVFLQVPREGVFYFDQTFRPVPLCQKFIGIKEPIQKPRAQVRRKKIDIYNEVCYDILCEVLKHQKQVLVFVHSRKETVNYAKYVQIRAQMMNQTNLFASSKHNLKTMNKVQDGELSKLIPYAIGFHHAGMLRPDRNAVERLFLEGDIRVLVATATLAWGVNLPAFAVIIKGTDVFDMSRADMQNLSVLDVAQMFGRAGRPQFDNQGEATLITDINNVGQYMASLNNASYIESKLMGFLKEALNAEIVLGNITNYTEAYDWVNHTFFSIRLQRNPLHYGVTKIYGKEEVDRELLVNEKITLALKELDELRMARYDGRNHIVVATELGRIASHYYIRCETMKILCEQMGIHFDTSLPLEQGIQVQSKFKHRSMYDLLKILAMAKEFEVLKVRPEEMSELRKIFQNYWIFEDQPKLGIQQGDEYISEQDQVIETPEKVIALISGYIEMVHYDVYALVMDTNIVIQNAIRLARCMLEMAIKKNLAQMVHTLLKMCKLLENRMSEIRTPLAQFSREIFTGYNSRKQINNREGYINPSWLNLIDQQAKYIPINELVEMQTDELCSLLGCGRQAIPIFRKFCHWLPQIQVEYKLKPIASSILQVQLKVTPDFRYSSRWHLKQEPFWVFVDDEQEILHCEQFLMSQKHIEDILTIEVKFFIPYSKGIDRYALTITSDRWIMRTEYYEQLDLSGIVMQDDLVGFTDLLDLQPLPTRVLGKSEYEQLFKFQYFNPIQTQVFHALFHSNDNVLIGAPTGSGKTIMAEFAIFRVFIQTPDKKVVYIAPMKAIAKERLNDWNKRFQRLNKVVLELTGDYTPDIAALMKADLLITTPEKWDGISRSWHNRQYVQQTSLLIFDEIHLLGQDRGPVLEVIVSRMNLVGSKSTGIKVRMIGLSTAIANGTDVGEWFGVKNNRFYNFKPSVRPVPVTIHFSGFPERAYCPRMGTMNKPAFQDIKRYSDGKPVIIFVSSRRQTFLTAMDLITLQINEYGSNNSTFVKCNQWEIENIQNQIQDEYLKQTIIFGIGMHHAGLSVDDKNIIEEIFLQAKIQVLIATSTLAWGVNLPARLVIIKGTEFYDPKLKKYIDMPVTDILQMIGRAGRPQFDTQATACVYVEQSKKDFYRKYLNSPFPIESSLIPQLPDHVNAEINSGSITNPQQCIDWITWTYFFRRLLKNPSYYGLLNNDKSVIKKYLIDLVDHTLKILHDYGCIVYKKNFNSIQPTFLGYLASFYYVRYQTIKHFELSILRDSTLPDLLRVLAYSNEYDEVPMRHNEDNLNEALAKSCPLKTDNKKLDSPQEKTFLLFQAHMFRLTVPIRDYTTDMKLVVNSSIRLLYAMIEVSSEKGYLQTTLNLMKLVQFIVQGTWINSNYLINVPHFDQSIVHQLKEYHSVSTLYDLIRFVRSDPNKLKQIMFKQTTEQNTKLWQDTLQSIYQIPQTKIKVHIDPVDENNNEKAKNQQLTQGCQAIISINIQTINDGTFQNAKIHRLTKSKDAGFWLLVGLPQEDQLLAVKKIFFLKNTQKELRIQMPSIFENSGELFFYLISDTYIGMDNQIQLKYK